MASEINSKSRVALKKLTRRQLMELDTCAHCGLCTDKCPAYNQSENPLHAPGIRSSKTIQLYNRKFDFLTRLLGKKVITEKDITELSDSAYHCTLCGRCREECPFGFQTHDLWVKVREIVRDLDGNPKNIQRLEKMMEESRNPYGLDSDTRLDWADYTDLEDYPEKDQAEIAYFVGCTTAYKGVNHEVAFSIASILNKLEEDWTLLGEDEWCCGNPSLISGDEHGAKEYAIHNIKELESRGIKKVITGCSGCFRVFKFEYPKLLGRELNFDVVHAVEYLRDKLVSGELKVIPTDEVVIYHDPCELSRLGGIISEPREALSYIAKNRLEFEEHGMDVRCCGGGGLLQAVNNDMRISIVNERLAEANIKGAKILVSACPACKLAFVDGVRESKIEVEVLDLLELAAKQLGFL